jgi:hypothetical protein
MNVSPKDLQIGNLLTTPDGSVEVVEILQIELRTRSFPNIHEKREAISEVSAISLNRVIVEEAGFILKTEGYYQAPLHLNEENGNWYMRIDHRYINRKELKYLHQLQNLCYLLIGEEQHKTPWLNKVGL